MPLHDWSHVRHGMFHHFHNSWIYKLADQLNAGTLPQGFYAAGEQISGRAEPDVVTLEQTPAAPWDRSSALAVAEHPPTAAVHQESELEAWLRKQDSLAIRHVGDDRLIAVIEIVSPANKSSRQRLTEFVEKVARLLSQGVHALVVDVFPPGRLDPDGLHAAIWEYATGEPATLLPGRQPAAMSYSASQKLEAFVEPCPFGKTLPSQPLFLDEGWYIPAPLEASYAAAWEHYPQPWKDQLATGM
jgi:hypothetical protein